MRSLFVIWWTWLFQQSPLYDRTLTGNKTRLVIWVPVNSSHGEVTSSLSRFFTFVMSSPCDDFTLWRLHRDELYYWCLLYSTLAVGVPCLSVAVVCWWRACANQFWDDVFIILSHILRLKCIKFGFNWGSTPDPAGGAYNCSIPQTIWI